jgi:hypothetical protein
MWLPPRSRLPVTRALRTATFVWMAGILVVSLLPGMAAAPGGTLWHLIGYAVLGALWGQWQAGRIVWPLATAYGAVIEGLQWLVPYRVAELADLLTNAVGVLIGLALSGVWMGRRRR